MRVDWLGMACILLGGGAASAWAEFPASTDQLPTIYLHVHEDVALQGLAIRSAASQLVPAGQTPEWWSEPAIETSPSVVIWGRAVGPVSLAADSRLNTGIGYTGTHRPAEDVEVTLGLVGPTAVEFNADTRPISVCLSTCVPEPHAWWLVACALVGLSGARQRKGRQIRAV